MPSSPKAAVTAENARFVFVGTVQRLRAATMDNVPIDNRTAIVRVDEVIHAPEALSHYAGHDLTVHLGGRKPVREGQQATFYTTPWLFGDSVGVESIKHDEVRRTASQTTREVGDPARRLAQRDLQSRFADAKLVVSGRVTSVRIPDDVVAAGARGARGLQAAAPTRISEHDPDWRIADIQVDEVHKGSAPRGPVSVRFPSSQDVAWFDAPKFHPGQEGVFMLHSPAGTAAPGTARTLRGLAPDTGEFIVPRAADFQPFSDPASMTHVIEALRESGGNKEAPQEEAEGRPRKRAKRSPSTRAKRSVRRASSVPAKRR